MVNKNYIDAVTVILCCMQLEHDIVPVLRVFVCAEEHPIIARRSRQVSGSARHTALRNFFFGVVWGLIPGGARPQNGTMKDHFTRDATATRHAD